VIRYLSRPEVAARIGVQKDTLNRYKLPPPDAQIGVRQVGWLPETIDAWQAARPGRGRRPR
jgi:predicted DNA-binding transcriptional regulator AlpA